MLVTFLVTRRAHAAPKRGLQIFEPDLTKCSGEVLQVLAVRNKPTGPEFCVGH
jgi:hypothetical protein